MVDSKDNCCKMMYDAMLEGYALLKIMKNADNEPYDYSIIEINKKFEAIVGVSRNEVIGKTVGQALPEFGESWFKISKSVTQTVDLSRKVQSTNSKYFKLSSYNICQLTQCPIDSWWQSIWIGSVNPSLVVINKYIVKDGSFNIFHAHFVSWNFV